MTQHYKPAFTLYKCSVCYVLSHSILLYQNTSVYHRISFRNKLTAYCGAGDQFDLKLEITAYNAEPKEVVKVVCQNDVKLFVRS